MVEGNRSRKHRREKEGTRRPRTIATEVVFLDGGVAAAVIDHRYRPVTNVRFKRPFRPERHL